MKQDSVVEKDRLSGDGGCILYLSPRIGTLITSFRQTSHHCTKGTQASVYPWRHWHRASNTLGRRVSGIPVNGMWSRWKLKLLTIAILKHATNASVHAPSNPLTPPRLPPRQSVLLLQYLTPAWTAIALPWPAKSCVPLYIMIPFAEGLSCREHAVRLCCPSTIYA